MNLDEISGIVVDFLNEAYRVFVRINYFNIPAPAEISAGTFAPIAAATVG